MRNWIRKNWEASLIRLARYILLGRNLERSPVVSRRDNNDMWSMGERLEPIEARIRDGYNSILTLEGKTRGWLWWLLITI